MRELYFGNSEFVYGIGCDVLDMRRLESFDEDKLRHFARKVLHEDEFAEFESTADKKRFVAVRFSVKESVAKAVKTGFRGFSMSDICVIKTELGAPEVLFYGRFKDIIEEKGIARIEVSVSHDGGLCFTNAIALRK